MQRFGYGIFEASGIVRRLVGAGTVSPISKYVNEAQPSASSPTIRALTSQEHALRSSSNA